ncbi:MAG: histidine phosphatase family protein, partial [Acidimicrobiales bacterium]
HGQSVWNVAEVVQGQSDAPGLTEIGRAQAREVAERLSDCGAGLVLSSDLGRAVETATPIAQRLGTSLFADPFLRERNLGSAERRSSVVLGPSVTGYGDHRVVDPDAHPPGGESLRELYDRVATCLERWRSDPPSWCFVAVTHGGFLRVAKNCLEGVPVELMTSPSTPNVVVWLADLGSGELWQDPPASAGSAGLTLPIEMLRRPRTSESPVPDGGSTL